MAPDSRSVRAATVDEADEVAGLLHDFNTEFDSPSPGPVVLASRLRELLGSTELSALLVGDPAVALALVTVRPSVWYDGKVATLDELYVRPDRRGQGIGSILVDHLFWMAAANGIDAIEINVDEGDVDAQRFYFRHGFSMMDPDTGERAFYFFRDLAGR